MFAGETCVLVRRACWLDVRDLCKFMQPQIYHSGLFPYGFYGSECILLTCIYNKTIVLYTWVSYLDILIIHRTIYQQKIKFVL